MLVLTKFVQQGGDEKMTMFRGASDSEGPLLSVGKTKSTDVVDGGTLSNNLRSVSYTHLTLPTKRIV